MQLAQLVKNFTSFPDISFLFLLKFPFWVVAMPVKISILALTSCIIIVSLSVSPFQAVTSWGVGTRLYSIFISPIHFAGLEYNPKQTPADELINSSGAWPNGWPVWKGRNPVQVTLKSYSCDNMIKQLVIRNRIKPYTINCFFPHWLNQKSEKWYEEIV